MELATELAAAEPSHLVARVTTMFPAVIVPAGNPDPIKFTFVTPATPLLGVVKVVN